MLEGVAEDQANSFHLLTRYAGMSYNLLEANPEGDFYRGGIDPGIKTTRHVFKLTNNLGKQSFYSGREVTVPDQVVFHAVETCAEGRSNQTFIGRKSYIKELSANLRLDAGLNLDLSGMI